MEELSNYSSAVQYHCECSDEKAEISENTKKTLETVVESYLKEKRILDLLNFMLTKVIAEAPEKPVLYLEKLLDDCRGFLSNRSRAPTLYKTRHLEAVVKSFDPCQKGWLNRSQVLRLYGLLSLDIDQNEMQDSFSVDDVLEDLKKKQELALRELLSTKGNKSDSIW